MTDWDHYKKAYSGEWDAGNRRERLVADTIERLGFTVQMEGLGAGSTAFISGRADEHGKDKADPDLFVQETATYIEVTGTNVGWVRPNKDIRVRPDKFENALATPDDDHWIVHVLDGPAVIRCIELTEAVCEEFVERGTSIDTRHDRNETYVEIDPNHDCIQEFTTLLAHLAPEHESAFDTAINESLSRWTAVDDITDGARHSIALKVVEDDEWDDHDSIARRLHLVDTEGDEVIMTIFKDSDFASNAWEEETWYFFFDVEGEFYQGDPYLKPKTDADCCQLTPEFEAT